MQEHVNVLDQSNEAHECKAIDERFGTCYEAIQCDKRGGIPMGKCSNAIGYVCCVCMKYIKTIYKFLYI